jgi:alkanesulfonate monooxygenase SsuD/methylene tetrahydromethanopterin reductase-like flavin-dependent oxidoreductase (luciferase family)
MMMTDRRRPSFGIKIHPVDRSYDDFLRLWQEADAVPAIEHSWLWDQMLPQAGPADGAVLDAWTLLPALAAHTERLRIGMLTTSNRIRPPGVLAKMAATADVISGGRLDFGIGVGHTALRDLDEGAVREFEAYGLPLVPFDEGLGSLAETCAIVKRMWTEGAFDFHGRHHTLKGAVCEPKPVQRPRPPILIGGWGRKTLRVVAEHADIWNAVGPPRNDIDDIADRCRLLDEHCAAIGRDPQEIVRSAVFGVSVDDPAQTRATIQKLLGIGVSHFVLAFRVPPPGGMAWLADEIIAPVI